MLLLFFVALLVLVNLATWPDRNVRNIGVALALGCILSNVVAYGDQESRAGVYSMIEIMVTATTFVAYTLQPDMPGKNLLRGLVGVSLLSVCLNVAYLGVLPASSQQQLYYDIATNLCFAAECLLAGATGVLVGVDDGRFSGRFGGGWFRAGSYDAAREEHRP